LEESWEIVDGLSEDEQDIDEDVFDDSDLDPGYLPVDSETESEDENVRIQQILGGVDLRDSFMSRNNIKIRSKKWYFRIFYHLVYVTIINAWLLYKTAECLCKEGTMITNKLTRPSSLDAEISKRRKKGIAFYVPSDDIRNDKVGHFPIFAERGRCKLPKCKKLSYVKCGNFENRS
ncbi:hypothetical protein ILUMI_06888, partial [Ignelater luminosus]